MNDLSQEPSEAGEVPGEQHKPRRKTKLTFKGLTTPGTAFTSPWMDSSKSPDPCFVNIVNPTALAGVNTNDPNPNLVIALSEPMSPTDKIDSWFASTSARPTQPLTSHPCIRDRALPTMQTDASIDGHSKVTASSPSAMRDPFFDSVPKGPRLPVVTSWAPTQDQPQTSPWEKTEASVSPRKSPKSPVFCTKSDVLQIRSSKRILVHCYMCRYQIQPQSVTTFEVHNRWQIIPRSHSHKLVLLTPRVPLFLL